MFFSIIYRNIRRQVCVALLAKSGIFFEPPPAAGWDSSSSSAGRKRYSGPPAPRRSVVKTCRATNIGLNYKQSPKLPLWTAVATPPISGPLWRTPAVEAPSWSSWPCWTPSSETAAKFPKYVSVWDKPPG